ncbi:MAG: hypothetical protein ABI347_08680 [Nitrososphaera sp.]|jgi:hypothetical protein
MSNPKDQKNTAKPEGGKKNDSASFDDAMKKQWSDTTEERAKYQAEHQGEIDRNLKAAEKARNQEDREMAEGGAS